MGDRATIGFGYSEAANPIAVIYIHNGGSYADKILAEFFQAEKNAIATRTRDSRFSDPSYLAARFVAWSSNSSGLGVGILPAADGTADWTVTCSEDRTLVPTVTRT